MKEVVDDAFVDRCRIKEFIDLPNSDCVYEILRSALNELIRKDLVSSYKPGPQVDSTYEKAYLPNLEWVVGHLEYQPDPIPKQLQRIAQTAIGISARTLRALPFSALVGHIVHEPCHIYELLEALDFEIRKEKGLHNGIRLPAIEPVNAWESTVIDEDSDSGGCAVVENTTEPAKENPQHV